MSFRWHFAVVSILAAGCVSAVFPQALLAADGEAAGLGQVPEFSLKDYRGAQHSLADFHEKKLVVCAFLGTECPLAKLYAPRLVELARAYAGRDVAFVAVNSNQQDSLTKIAAYARQHEVRFPILKDPGNVFADQLKVTRTPEVLVWDQSQAIRYRGRIDDQYGVGTARSKPTRNELRDALDALLAGQPVAEPVTQPVGCLIGRVRKSDDDSPVTYSRQIARILQQRCVECHREGEIAPFTLTSYQDAVGWAEMIGEVVAEERMPPWHADARHGKFANDRRLTETEKS
ncbi:MAG: thioredoxin family protein, partial [Planctomycetaceae bacterium]